MMLVDRLPKCEEFWGLYYDILGMAGWVIRDSWQVSTGTGAGALHRVKQRRQSARLEVSAAKSSP